MKKILLLFLFVYSFAINDFLVKPKLSDYSFTPLLPKVLYSYSDEDNYNVYLYSKYFRVIYGIDYNNSDTMKNLANSIFSLLSFAIFTSLASFLARTNMSASQSSSTSEVACLA